VGSKFRDRPLEQPEAGSLLSPRHYSASPRRRSVLKLRNLRALPAAPAEPFSSFSSASSSFDRVGEVAFQGWWAGFPSPEEQATLVSSHIQIVNAELMRWLVGTLKTTTEFTEFTQGPSSTSWRKSSNQRGFEVKVVGRWNQADGGIDVLAARRDTVAGEFRIGIQLQEVGKDGRRARRCCMGACRTIFWSGVPCSGRHDHTNRGSWVTPVGLHGADGIKRLRRTDRRTPPKADASTTVRDPEDGFKRPQDGRRRCPPI
jgi:hypothetical protein